MERIYLSGRMHTDWRDEVVGNNLSQAIWLCPKKLSEARRQAFEADMQLIQAADAIFVWLDATADQAHGTFAEIGLAYGLSKPVYVATSNSLSEMGDFWFVLQMAAKVWHTNSAVEGVQQFLMEIKDETRTMGENTTINR